MWQLGAAILYVLQQQIDDSRVLLPVHAKRRKIANRHANLPLDAPHTHTPSQDQMADALHPL
jgi:hypothetical protein